MGPIQILLLGFEDFQATGGIADELIALSDAGTIRIIDARLLMKESADEVIAVRMSDLDDSEREDLRMAAGALVGLGAGAVLGGDDGAAAGVVLGAEAALSAGELGLSDVEIGEIADELDDGDALLLLVIENVWARGLANAIRGAGVVSARQDYVSPEGLVALGTMLGLQVALEEWQFRPAGVEPAPTMPHSRSVEPDRLVGVPAAIRDTRAGRAGRLGFGLPAATGCVSGDRPAHAR